LSFKFIFARIIYLIQALPLQADLPYFWIFLKEKKRQKGCIQLGQLYIPNKTEECFLILRNSQLRVLLVWVIRIPHACHNQFPTQKKGGEGEEGEGRRLYDPFQEYMFTVCM